MKASTSASIFDRCQARIYLLSEVLVGFVIGRQPAVFRAQPFNPADVFVLCCECSQRDPAQALV